MKYARTSIEVHSYPKWGITAITPLTRRGITVCARGKRRMDTEKAPFGLSRLPTCQTRKD